jgi:hypothetical protein
VTGKDKGKVWMMRLLMGCVGDAKKGIEDEGEESKRVKRDMLGMEAMQQRFDGEIVSS